MSAKRTVLFVHASAETGGTELQMFEITRWLRARGFDVLALFDCEPGPVMERYRREGLPVVHRQDGLWPSRWLRAWIRERAPRAAFLHGLRVNLKWRVWLRLFFPDIRRWGSNRGLTNSRRVPWHRIVLDRLTLPLLEGYVTNSRFVANYLIERGFPETKVIYLKNFVPAAEAPGKNRMQLRRALGRGADVVLPAAVPVITYVATVRPVKGHDLLIEPLRRLKARGTRFVCLLVGDLPRDGGLLAAIRRADLEEEVVFTGVRDDVAAVLALSDIFVFPSLWEGCPNAVLEAMRAKLPIVASPWGDQAFLIEEGKGGFVLDPHDAAGWAERLERLIADPEMRRRFGEHNDRTVHATFRASDIEAATLALFDRMSK